MNEQLDRIEKKLDRALEATAANTADMKWVKRLVGGLGAVCLMLASHVLRKLGI